MREPNPNLAQKFKRYNAPLLAFKPLVTGWRSFGKVVFVLFLCAEWRTYSLASFALSGALCGLPKCMSVILFLKTQI